MTRRESIRLCLAYRAWYQLCEARHGFGRLDVLLDLARALDSTPRWLIAGELNNAAIQL